MIHEKKISVGNYLKRGEDIRENDIVEIVGECIDVPGEYGVQHTFKIKTADKEGNTVFNQTSINGLIDAYGKDDTKWIGQKVKVWKIMQNVSGKFIAVWYFAHPDALMGERGFILPSAQPNQKDIPIINDDEEVDVKTIPF